MHKVAIILHPEVSSNVTINVARTAEEAERQEAGEDVTVEAVEEDVFHADEVFEDGVNVDLEAEVEVEAEAEAEVEAEVEVEAETETAEEDVKQD